MRSVQFTDRSKPSHPSRASKHPSSVGPARAAVREAVSELTDEPDLRLQPVPEPFLDGPLREGDQLADVLRRGGAEVDHDVRVDVGDLRVADAVALEPALVDQPSRADALDL